MRGQNDAITFREWLDSSHTQEELRDVFINMDLAMKYIHEQGYYISSITPDTISILNHSIRQIQFRSLAELPDTLREQKEVIHQNIFTFAVFNIGVYADCLPYFTNETIKFLKTNFSFFADFIPNSDVPYYRGIIERGASVYFSDYVAEKKKKDLTAIENDVSSAMSSSKRLVKSNGNYSAEDFLPHNDKENQMIYADLMKNNGAFARAMIYPILILIMGIVAVVISYLFQ